MDRGSITDIAVCVNDVREEYEALGAELRENLVQQLASEWVDSGREEFSGIFGHKLGGDRLYVRVRRAAGFNVLHIHFDELYSITKEQADDMIAREERLC